MSFIVEHKGAHYWCQNAQVLPQYRCNDIVHINDMAHSDISEIILIQQLIVRCYEQRGSVLKKQREERLLRRILTQHKVRKIF